MAEESPSLSLSLSPFVCLSVSLSVSLSLCLCLSVSVFLSLPVSVCRSLYVYFSMCLFLSLCPSVSVSLRPELILGVEHDVERTSTNSVSFIKGEGERKDSKRETDRKSVIGF